MDEPVLPRGIEIDDVYRFKGLPRAVSEDVIDDEYDTERLITVLDICVTGELAVRIDVDGDQGQTLQGVRYADARLLIDDGVWELVQLWER